MTDFTSKVMIVENAKVHAVIEFWEQGIFGMETSAEILGPAIAKKAVAASTSKKCVRNSGYDAVLEAVKQHSTANQNQFTNGDIFCLQHNKYGDGPYTDMILCEIGTALKDETKFRLSAPLN